MAPGGPGAGARQPDGDLLSENESNRGWQWLLPVSLIADVSAIVTVLSGSASTAALVIGVVALLIGAGLVVARFGKPVDGVVLLAVVGIIAGTAAVTVVATRAVTDVPGQASGTTPSGPTTTTGSSTAPATTTSPPPQQAPGVKRTSGDRPVQLTQGYGVDLDSTALDWGAVRTNQRDERYDLSYDGYSLSAREDLAPAKADATLEDCVSAGYKGSVSGQAVAPDATFCVKTNGRTFARVRLTEVKTGDLLVLDVLAWEPGK
ncbi:hypothetical protein [Lentzea sp.]|uniref:hypothetical protein n=1 Tax=Lentzea sp. TaxID=56099 RepID=UPI002C06A446|nr:hypothetical protein [Lentzea sp.]HUQ57469.1 hypothetical protein [Lentzea sp.]